MNAAIESVDTLPWPQFHALLAAETGDAVASTDLQLRGISEAETEWLRKVFPDVEAIQAGVLEQNQ